LDDQTDRPAKGKIIELEGSVGASPANDRKKGFDETIKAKAPGMVILASQRNSGIKDPYELNEDQYKAALDVLRKQHALIQRYWHDANAQVDDVQERRRCRLGLVALPGQLVAVRQAARCLDRAGRRSDRLGRHDDDGGRGQASKLHLPLARALAPAEGPRRRLRLVGSLPAVPAACKGNALLTEERMQNQRLRQFSAVSSSARRRRPACRIIVGLRTTSPSSVAGKASLDAGRLRILDRLGRTHRRPPGLKFETTPRDVPFERR